jgi:hypothetical protein
MLGAIITPEWGFLIVHMNDGMTSKYGALIVKGQARPGIVKCSVCVLTLIALLREPYFQSLTGGAAGMNLAHLVAAPEWARDQMARSGANILLAQRGKIIEVLERTNVIGGHAELSKHLSVINCFPGGKFEYPSQPPPSHVALLFRANKLSFQEVAQPRTEVGTSGSPPMPQSGKTGHDLLESPGSSKIESLR